MLGATAWLPIATPPAAAPTLTPADVKTLLDRAARATAADNAIVAVVDRGGNLLGVRVEGNVSPAITGNTEKLVFAVDGALAEARTGAFFANDQAPLTSRTIQDISQSTITQREVQSDPNITDPNSTARGPGLRRPDRHEGALPAARQFTPQVDLFQIEHTNRDSIISPGRRPASADTGRRHHAARPVQRRPRRSRPARPERSPRPSRTGSSPACSRSPSRAGSARCRGASRSSRERHTSSAGSASSSRGRPGSPPRRTRASTTPGSSTRPSPTCREEAEYIAFVAAGGSSGAGFSFNTPGGQPEARPAPAAPDKADKFDLPFGRIDLVGITLDIFGGHGLQGPSNLVDFGRTLGLGDAEQRHEHARRPRRATRSCPARSSPTAGSSLPHDSADGSLTAADVTAIIQRGIAEANQVRAAIRLPLDSTARMIFAVTDKAGNILGLYRMPDATFFSIDVAVAKARNVAYYADPDAAPADRPGPGPAQGGRDDQPDLPLPGRAALPRGDRRPYPPGPFSILNETGVRETGPPQPASSFQTVQGFDAFNPQTNFHDPYNIANQNGIVFFPGSAPLYKDVNGDGKKVLVGGLGVSGDGVDQDDDVTFQAAVGFEPPPDVLRADQVFVRGVRLPYQKFNRQPHVPIGEPEARR